MIQIHSVELVLFIYFFLICSNAFKTGTKQEKFEVILKDVYDCPEANPAYASKPKIFMSYKVNDINGKRYLTGVTTITHPTPFRNFSARTFFLNKGKREVKLQIASVSCKNVFARTIIVFSNISYTQRNCMLTPGRYQNDKLDLDKISHMLPNWHAPGELIHQLQLVSNGATEYCEEIAVEVKLVK